MIIRFVAGLVLSGLIAVPGFAADMPVKARMAVKAPPPVVYSWTGCYIGGNAGYGWQDAHNRLAITNGAGAAAYFNPIVIPGVEATGTGSLDSSGFTGGVQAGCNLQNGRVVWGVEGDFNWFDQGARFGGQFPFSNGAGSYLITVDDSKKWLATARGRVGYAHDRALFYATGGLAALRVDFAQTFIEPGFSDLQVASFSDTKLGWTVGAGIEAAPWGCCWSVKLEYLYARFNSSTVSSPVIGINAAAGRSATFTNNFGDINLNVVRAGLNYRFGN